MIATVMAARTGLRPLTRQPDLHRGHTTPFMPVIAGVISSGSRIDKPPEPLGINGGAGILEINGLAGRFRQGDLGVI